MIRLLEGSRVEDHGAYLAVRTPANPDFHWGNFLLLAEPPERGQAAAWLERFAAEFPEAEHVALGIDVTEVGGVDVGDFADAGLHLDRSAVLTAKAVQEPPRPYRGATYRELAGDDDWRQAQELRAVVSDDERGGDSGFRAARIASQRALTEAGHGSWFGAFVDGKLVAHLGLVTDGSAIARYQNVETHPDWRRKGIAATLVWHAGQLGLDSLASMLVIAADPDYVAIRVYRSVGFIDAETQIAFDRQPA
jgi:GNAT superfamily N-acetyltransferase